MDRKFVVLLGWRSGVAKPLASSARCPASSQRGERPRAVSVTGSGFLAATVMQVNGSARKTVYTSETHISVQLNIVDTAAAGGLVVAAVNPSPGEDTSSPAKVTITGATPILGSVSPSQSYVGAGDSKLQVTGIGLAPLKRCLHQKRPRSSLHRIQPSLSPLGTMAVISLAPRERFYRRERDPAPPVRSSTYRPQGCSASRLFRMANEW